MQKIRLFVCLLFVIWFPGQVDAATHRIALLIAHDGKGSKAKPLRYAVSDAYKVRSVLLQVAGYKKRHIYLSINRTASSLRRLFQTIQANIRNMRRTQPKDHVVLLVYYSGHARKGRFLLGDTQMRFEDMRAFLKKSGATLRLAFLDTCTSGLFLQTRGVQRLKKSFRIPILNTQSTRGEAIITSTGSRENAYEDVRLKGGIFTHFMSTGLRGAADQNKDNRITLDELYTYAYNRTINRTVFASAGPQKPHFRNNLRGAGQVILSTTKDIQTALHLRQKLQGQFFIWDHKRMLYAGFHKKSNKQVRIAMVPGRYTIQWRHLKRVFTTRIRLAHRKTFYLSQKQGRLVHFQAYRSRGITDDTKWEPLIPIQMPSEWGLRLQTGAAGANFIGSALMGGGALALQHRFFALRMGMWGTSVLFPNTNVTSPQLHVDLRVEGGYRFDWERWDLFLGVYAGVGLLFQDLFLSTPSTGITLHSGVTTIGTYKLNDRWSLGLQVSIGFDMVELPEGWQPFFHWSGLLGVVYQI